MLISPDYTIQNRILHETRPTFGADAKWIDRVLFLAQKHECKSVLDYGCGKGILADRIGATKYDPATFPGHPHPHDLVICLDVLEHVEPNCLDAVLCHIRELTLKVAFLVVATRPARKNLPDGRNAHLIIQSQDWWTDKLSEHFDLIIEPGDGEAIYTCERIAA